MAAPVPIQQRNQIITEYLLDGNQTRVAARHGLTEACLRRWKDKPWWEDTKAELQAEIADQVKYSAAGVIRASQERCMERLEKGDPFVMKGGEEGEGLVVYVPVRALDCARIGTLWLDRLRILEGKPTKISANIGLQQVMHQFQQLASQYQNDPSPTAVQDGEVIHSLPDPQLLDSK